MQRGLDIGQERDGVGYDAFFSGNTWCIVEAGETEATIVAG